DVSLPFSWVRHPVHSPSGSNRLMASSSSRVGPGVSRRSGATRTGQPVSARSSSSVTPGWRLSSTISPDSGSKPNTPRLVITRPGPPRTRPTVSRHPRPVPNPGEVRYRTRSGNRRRSWWTSTTVRRASAAMSAAPPLPGSRMRRPPSSAQVVLRLPNRSTSAPPRNPTSTRPRCRWLITSTSVVHMSAPAMLGGSPIVMIGAAGGEDRMTPFSNRPTARGACRARARANPRSGRRMPTNTTSPSRISRAAAATITWPRVIALVSMTPSSETVVHRGGRLGGAGAKPFHPVLAQAAQVPRVSARTEDHPVEPGQEARPRARLLVILVVEPVVAVDVPLGGRRVGSKWFFGDRAHKEARHERPIRIAGDDRIVHQLLAGEQHRLCRPRRLERDAHVAPQLRVAVAVAPLRVQDRDVRPQRADGQQPISGKRAGHLAHSLVVPHDVRPERRPGGQVRHPRRRGRDRERHGEVGVVFHRERPGDSLLDGPPEVVGDPGADVPHPGGDDLGDAPGADELIEQNVGNRSDQHEVSPALPDDLVAGGE